MNYPLHICPTVTTTYHVKHAMGGEGSNHGLSLPNGAIDRL